MTEIFSSFQTNLKMNILCFILLLSVVCAKKSDGKDKPDWAKKDIRDYTEADLERLLDQWEVSWHWCLFKVWIASQGVHLFLDPIIDIW